MAVNGFLVDSEVQKYNYESLENYNTPDFSTSSTYQVGDYVMYQGKLYKCITEITTSGGWDSSKWSLAILSDDVANLKSALESGAYGLSESAKQAILQIARKVTYIDTQGQTYYNALYNAFYPLVELSFISAVYTQSGTVYDTDSLDSLKADLVVTAHYSDSSTAIVAAVDYTLSGTLAVGTSIITVSYGGKTTTFNVVVSLGLDSIAFGTLTYRDLFVTNNEVVIGDFETTLSLSSTTVNLGNGRSYKVNAGSPVQTTEDYESPTHSLKCFGASSSQILYKNTQKQFNASPYLFCVSAKVTRYSAGQAGIQFTLPANGTITTQQNVSANATTTGFAHIVKIATPSGTDAQRLGINIFIGSFASANLDAYVDDVICTPVPADMTEAKALELYEEYLTMIGA